MYGRVARWFFSLALAGCAAAVVVFLSRNGMRSETGMGLANELPVLLDALEAHADESLTETRSRFYDRVRSLSNPWKQLGQEMLHPRQGRRHAASLLASIYFCTPPGPKQLKCALSSADENTATGMMMLLEDAWQFAENGDALIGKKIGGSFVPDEVVGLAKRHPRLEEKACSVLRLYREHSAGNVRFVVGCLLSPDEFVRMQAALALGVIDPILAAKLGLNQKGVEEEQIQQNIRQYLLLGSA